MNKYSYQRVSVIVTTKNEEDVIGTLLKSIKKQTYPSIETLIVDNHSSDNTIKIAKKYEVECFTFGPERSAQRNFGAKKSRGKYLLFLDADMELNPRVVESCVEVAKKGNFNGVAIPEQSVALNFWGRVKAFERSFYNEKGDPITDAARFFAKNVFVKVGGYDETITGPEDWDLPDTIREKGYRIGRSQEKIYHHEQEISLTDLFKKKFYYGLHAHQYLVKHKIALVSPRTIYFLRPLFYKNWTKLIYHPLLSLAMTYMLFVETLGGGLGYILGRLRKK